MLTAHFAILSHVFPAHEQVPFLLAIPLSIAEMFAVYILVFGNPQRLRTPRGARHDTDAINKVMASRCGMQVLDIKNSGGEGGILYIVFSISAV
jgi:hypothetical protein